MFYDYIFSFCVENRCVRNWISSYIELSNDISLLYLITKPAVHTDCSPIQYVTQKLKIGDIFLDSIINDLLVVDTAETYFIMKKSFSK